jgi:hypothetical protein
MTKARDLANLISGGFTEADIPNLSASKITSGTFADARIAASNVSQHATSFDDNKIVNDISTLALRQASNENKAGYNTNSMSVDVFQDATKITGLTNAKRTEDEYVAALSTSTSTNFTIGNNGGSPNYSTYFGLQADTSSSQGFMVQESTSNVVASTINAFGTSNNFTTMSLGSYSNVMEQQFNKPGDFGDSTPATRYSLQFNFSGSRSYYFLYKLRPLYQGKFVIKRAKVTWQNGSSGTDDLHLIYLNESNNSVSSLYQLDTGTLSNAVEKDSGASGFTNTTAHNVFGFWTRYTSGNSGGYDSVDFIGDLEVDTINATGSFEGTTVTAPSSVSSMGAIITYQDNAGTNALNTDIVLKLSADNGSNYSTATLTAMPDFSSGIKMAKVNDLSVTAGTQLKYKIEFANQSASKEARIRGVSLQY